MPVKISHNPETEAKQIRLLLFLWDMGGIEEAVSKGQLTQRLKRSKEKSKDYQEIYEKLEAVGAIAFPKKNKVSLVAPQGLQMLAEGLRSPEFKFKRQVGAKTVNALLEWLRSQETSGNGAVGNGVSAGKTETAKNAIASYDEFKSVALDVYDRLNRDYNLDDLVPIYRIRREIGDRVSRSQFNEWLLEMQANDIVQLQGGSVEDSAPDKLEDSITTKLGGLRCYAKRL